MGVTIYWQLMFSYLMKFSVGNEIASIKINALCDFLGYGRIYRESVIAEHNFSQLYSPVSVIL